MLPPFIYERLPSLYLLVAMAIIMLSEHPLLWFAGTLIFIAGCADLDDAIKLSSHRPRHFSRQTLAAARVVL